MAHKEIFGVVDMGKDDEGKDKNFWVRIGTGFECKDGSLNLKFNFLPTDLKTTIQVREPRPRDGK